MASLPHRRRSASATDLGVLPAQAVWWKYLFEEAEDAIVVCNPFGAIALANKRATAQLGLGPAACLFDVSELSSADANLLRQSLARTEREPAALAGIRFRCPRGSALVTDLHLVPFEKTDWLIVIKDASRRWRLEAQTQRLLAAIDSTPDVVILTDDSFHITFVNPAFETATGHTLEEALGRSVDSFQSPDEQAKSEEYLQGARRGADWVGELVMVRKDGSHYPVEMTFSPIQSGPGECIGAVAFQRDITSRRRIHDAFLAERNFVRSIINSLDGSLYTLDGKLRLTHVNDGWQRMPAEHGWLRLNGPPQVGRSFLEYVPDPTHRAELERNFRLVLAEGQPQEWQTVDEAGRHWQMKVFPWQHGGQIRGLIYKVTDNSAFVGVQNQLFQAQKMGTIGALAAGVAHDFNNLLLAIRGNVGLALLDPKTTPEIRTRLDQVEEAAARASDLSQQLLSFSRLSEEKVTVLDFNQVIKDATAMAKRVLRGKVSLKLQPTEAPIKVQLDLTRAVQMLLNLCINAHDAMPKGGTLTVTNSYVDLTDAQWTKVKRRRDGQFMRCSVADTGTGIPPELLPRIFSPFFTTKEKGKGTGLGLSIVHNVVSRAGGFIEVESVVGSGTTFHVYLPVNTGPLTRTDTELKQQLKKGSGRLLVVDDLDLVLEFAANFLKQAGYQVFTANGAEAALKVLVQQKGSIDLLFTDYSMPGRNGWQLIQDVNSHWPLTKCLLASGYLDDEERAEIAKNPAVRILNKPYGIPEATRVIAEMLGKTA
jgi:PAS domain S-box-containing protein